LLGLLPDGGRENFFKETIKFGRIEAREAGIESSWLDNCYDHQEQFFYIKMMNNQTEAGELITNFSGVGEQ